MVETIETHARIHQRPPCTGRFRLAQSPRQLDWLVLAGGNRVRGNRCHTPPHARQRRQPHCRADSTDGGISGIARIGGFGPPATSVYSPRACRRKRPRPDARARLSFPPYIDHPPPVFRFDQWSHIGDKKRGTLEKVDAHKPREPTMGDQAPRPQSQSDNYST